MRVEVRASATLHQHSTLSPVSVPCEPEGQGSRRAARAQGRRRLVRPDA
jgi:hypothetical protein